MSQKVWVIEDNTGKQVSRTTISRKSNSVFQQNSTKQRNPSLAYSLSIIIWGCGQFYNRQWRLGTLYFLFMMNFYLYISIAVIYWEFIKSYFESININYSEILLIFGFFYLSGLIFWHFNAWQAYFKSIKSNEKSLKRINMTLLPAVCSLLMPGWGQLLNGQVKKALFIQLLALTGIAATSFIFIIFSVWPTLELSRPRFIIEWIFSLSIIFSPFVLTMWIFSIFDAVKVNIDSKIKEPLSRRIKYAKNRFRGRIQIYGWKNAVLPLIKRMILIILLLVFCIISYHHVPKQFYVQQLQNLGNRMSEKEMTIIPNIIKNFLIVSD